VTERKIICPVYRPLPNSRRCADFIDNGGCRREDTFLCSEWLRANPKLAVPDVTPLAMAVRGDAVPGKALQGPAVRGAEPEVGGHSDRRPPAAASAAPVRVVAVRALTNDDVESFRALGVSVSLRTEDGTEIWIVDEYSQLDRNELRADHAATLAALCAAFPGARATKFVRHR
jgi:hypothetical protein